MKPGCYIDSGPCDWQIIQQENGIAKVGLAGRYLPSGERPDRQIVFVRVVREESSDTVLPWLPATIHEGQRWEISLELPVGGLYRIETSLKPDGLGIEYAFRGDMVHHIGVGELFVITGQSNSAGYGKDPIFDPPELGVHVLRNNGKWDLATHPLNDSTGSIHPLNAEMINPGHSPYLSFAKYLKRELNNPIGLIQASLGGSSLGQWNPAESGELYRNLLEIVKSCGRLRGVLWYQGCSDTTITLSQTYGERFANFVKSLRRDLATPNLPFFTVQLNRFVADPGTWGMGDEGWSRVREAQRCAAKELPGVFVVPAIDLPLSDNIHNSSYGNVMLGERLAKSVLKHLFSRDLQADAPDIAAALATGGRELRLIFDNVSSRLYAFDLKPGDLPLSIFDEYGEIEIEDYSIEDNMILLRLSREPGVQGGVHNQYGANPGYLSIIDAMSHLPALAFYGFKISKDL
jgi:hypothetical protein